MASFMPKVSQKFGKSLRDLQRAAAEDPTTTEATTTDPNAPHVRLVRCSHPRCRTLEEIPDTGPNPPREDPFVRRVVEEHKHRHPESLRDDRGPLLVLRVPMAPWRDPVLGPELHKRIWADKAVEGGFIPEYAATKSTFQEDAMRCFSRHHRPAGGECLDYMDDSKLLGNSLPTEASAYDEKRRAQVAGVQAPVKLCQFCPVHSEVQAKINEKRFR